MIFFFFSEFFEIWKKFSLVALEYLDFFKVIQVTTENKKEPKKGQHRIKELEKIPWTIPSSISENFII